MPDQTIFGKYDKFKGGLVERQDDGLGCGRHALNNLFGDVYFTAYQDGVAYTIDEIKEAVEKLSTDPKRFVGITEIQLRLNCCRYA